MSEPPLTCIVCSWREPVPIGEMPSLRSMSADVTLSFTHVPCPTVTSVQRVVVAGVAGAWPQIANVFG